MWEVSNEDIKGKIEKILSDILSNKHEAKIRIKFVEGKRTYGNKTKTDIISKQQILDKQA